MIADEDKEALAAEYVLGTLDADERAQAEALMLIDPGFTAVVRGWERRLGELNAMVAPVEPVPALWDRIRAQVAETAPSATVRLPDVDGPKPVADGAPAGADVVVLAQRVKRWRTFTGLTTALAASLAAIMVLRDYRPDMLPKQWQPRTVAQAPAQFVAVFQKDEQSPAFILSVDTDRRVVTVRQVAAEKRPDRSYQLWIATQPGAAPRSLGLIGAGDFTVHAALAAYDPAVINNATYGISDEPLGGSPTGAPTGPVIHAKLVQATP
jgi:anti-sigma-K factor RskA